MLRFQPIRPGAAIPTSTPSCGQSVVFSRVGLDLRGHPGSMTSETRTAETEHQSFGMLTDQVRMKGVPAGVSLLAQGCLGFRANV